MVIYVSPHFFLIGFADIPKYSKFILVIDFIALLTVDVLQFVSSPICLYVTILSGIFDNSNNIRKIFKRFSHDVFVLAVLNC